MSAWGQIRQSSGVLSTDLPPPTRLIPGSGNRQLDPDLGTKSSGIETEEECHCTKSLRDSPLRRALNWERVNQLREE